MILSNFFLFSKLVKTKNNLDYKKKYFDFLIFFLQIQSLDQILNCCLLDDIVKSSSKGFNQLIGNSGIQLSGGQLQRLSIARALYRPTSLLLMDEPTSSLDSKTSSLLINNLINYANKASITLVVVSHDNSIFDLFETRCSNV